MATDTKHIATRFLIVGENRDFWMTNLTKYLRGHTHEFLDHGNSAKIKLLEKLASGLYTCCIVMNIGSETMDEDWFSASDKQLKQALTSFTSSGHRLIFHGEGKKLVKIFKDWFGKPWNFTGDWYRRTTHDLQTAAQIPALIKLTLPLKYNVKACMLSNVDATDRVYCTAEGAMVQSLVCMPGFNGTTLTSGLCPVALSSFGNGKLGFIGDVNGEHETVKVMIALGLSEGCA